jgi:beta-N-acetylhexosaminidase
MKRLAGGIAALALLSAGCGPVAQHATGTAALNASAPAPSAASPAPSIPPPTQSAPAPPATSGTATCTPASAVARWPLSRRAAQVLAVPVLNFDVAGATAEVGAGAGGVLFLGNAAPPADLAARLHTLTSHATAARPLVMADEEGGGVQRLAGLVGEIPWARSMAATLSVAQTRALAEARGRQMLAAGVTTDLAPVLDVDGRPGPSSSNADGERSFSPTASVAAAYGTAFMSGLRSAGVLPVVKHFPGLGGAQRNTDVGPGATRSLTLLRSRDLVPFRAAIAAGAPAVMTSNASVPGLTPLPSSLSHAVIEGLLRHELGFHGLVITDSLSAGAVTAVTSSLADATVRSLAAGSDLVLFGSTLTPADVAALQASRTLATYRSVVATVVAAVRSGRLAGSRLDDAVLHVLAAKHVNPCL